MRSGGRASGHGSAGRWNPATSDGCKKTSSSASSLPSRSGSTSAASTSRSSRAVSATLMDGAALAARIRQELKEEVAELGHVGLSTILVGDDPASQTYIRLKHKAADEVGIGAIDRRLPA